MTTEIEAKLREIETQYRGLTMTKNERLLVQALRRALTCISQMAKTGSPRAVNSKTLDDILTILSAPNDKEGE